MATVDSHPACTDHHRELTSDVSRNRRISGRHLQFLFKPMPQHGWQIVVQQLLARDTGITIVPRCLG